MASSRHVSDSESDSSAAPVNRIQTPVPEESNGDQSLPQSVLSHRFRASPPRSQTSRSGSALAVLLSPPKNPWEYQPFKGNNTVDTILKDFEGADGVHRYTIEYEDGNQEDVTERKLLRLSNGQNALDFYNTNDSQIHETNSSSEQPSMDEPNVNSAGNGKRARTQRINRGFVNSSTIAYDTDEDELYPAPTVLKKRRLGKRQIGKSRESNYSKPELSAEESSSDIPPKVRHSARTTRSNGTSRQTKLRLVNKSQPSYAEEDNEVDDLADEAQDESEGSDQGFRPQTQAYRTKDRKGRSLSKGKRGRPRKHSSSSSPERLQPSRRSERERVTKNMRERDMDEEMYADDIPVNHGPKVISVREVFEPLSKQDPFVLLHNKSCDVCNGSGSNSNKGISPLIYCQGCTTAIHKVCLGYRSGREHLVTKIGQENFVMQCRRCIGVAARKDSLAPRLGACQSCKEEGLACIAFAPKRTSKQEEKLREANDGEDPITEVPEELVNNPENVLFRCTSCQQAYHFEHLPPLTEASKTSSDPDELHRDRFKQYVPAWQCKDCLHTPEKVQTLVAWRPADAERYIDGQEADDFREDEKEYLIKWEDESYHKCTWMHGGWVWGITAAVMRKAFYRRDEGSNNFPKWTADEAIPEEFLRIEIVLDVVYEDDFKSKSEAADKAAIHMVKEVYVKFQGLSYDEVAWEDPPSPDDGGRWSDFVAAYNEYVVGRYFKQPPAGAMVERTAIFRSLNFEKKVEVKKQPSTLTGGDMMPYQIEGLNWLLYNFHQKKNVILADEMGLGKTIQIISFIASLVKDSPKCWPFLVVTPNSTCPNWRREIKKWAPDLRVVAYYGGKQARSMAMDYELYPEKCSDLRAHVVVTSYEGPVDDSSKSFFRRIKWAGMIVDEGQRLKNDANLLYGALKALKVPFQVLLTGTPLQNNKRELFNLLQFLDTSIDAAELDDEYAELTKENLPELHELIRPFFLRRTKLQVLKFLPPMAQVILPVTMSVLQKRLYRSILEKNGELIKSILGQDKVSLKKSERGNLNNILMQLRKCLCHPFVYNTAIEEKNLGEDASHRHLIDASSKLQLLEIMLPKLQARGHRVLLFSQFLRELDIMEDFLNGLGMKFQRLDGNISALEKQKRIDAFNARDSQDFAFILSTRAGGVGINLATADTVIIMDPDFNPHQDIQALSRAHRIGQKNKVLCFQLMTKDSAEEKIIQIGRKKMALDHALIESMGADEDTSLDLETILKHGAEALFNEDDRNDIHYNSASVDQLLDRAQVETTVTDEDKSAESQFSFARVWANDKGDLTEDIEVDEQDSAAPNSDFWDKILRKREAEAAAEAARNMQTFGRGKRARQAVNYEKSNMDLDDDMPDSSPPKQASKRRPDHSASDLDFPDADDTDGDEDSDIELLDAGELQSGRPSKFGTPRKGTAKKRVLNTPKHLDPSNQRSTPSNSHGARQRPAGAGKQKIPARQLVIVKSANANRAVTGRGTESSVQKPTPTTAVIPAKGISNNASIRGVNAKLAAAPSKIQKVSSKAPLRKNKEIAEVHQPADSVPLMAKNGSGADFQAKLKPALPKPKRNVDFGISPGVNALETSTDHSRSKARQSKAPGVDMPKVEAQVELGNQILATGTSQ